MLSQINAALRSNKISRANLALVEAGNNRLLFRACTIRTCSLLISEVTSDCNAMVATATAPPTTATTCRCSLSFTLLTLKHHNTKQLLFQLNRCISLSFKKLSIVIPNLHNRQDG